MFGEDQIKTPTYFNVFPFSFPVTLTLKVVAPNISKRKLSLFIWTVPLLFIGGITDLIWLTITCFIKKIAFVILKKNFYTGVFSSCSILDISKSTFHFGSTSSMDFCLILKKTYYVQIYCIYVCRFKKIITLKMTA